MILEALKYLIGLGHLNDISIHGGNICSVKNISYIEPKRPTQLNLNTLSSLVEYVKSEKELKKEDIIIHIDSPVLIKIFKKIDDLRSRFEYVIIEPYLNNFKFNSIYVLEEFIIQLQTNFINNKNIQRLIEFSSSIAIEDENSIKDDGITQEVTIRSGIIKKEFSKVPNPITLKPYRTFIEVNQPESTFIFRLKKGPNNSIFCVLHDTDGGLWMTEAKTNILNYLKENLSDVLIIS